jgi:hypothetical protein
MARFFLCINIWLISFLSLLLYQRQIDMRLTVHVEGAKRSTDETNTKDGVKKITRTMNTLSFSGVNPEDVQTILNSIPKEQGLPVKHYLSNEKIPGHSRGKKK